MLCNLTAVCLVCLFARLLSLLPIKSTTTRTFPHFHHHHPPIYNINRSTINVYKIDSGRSVRVRNKGYPVSVFKFSLYQLGKCPRCKGKCPGEYARGGMSRGEYPTLIGTMRPEHLKRWRRTISAKSASNYVEQIFDLCTK